MLYQYHLYKVNKPIDVALKENELDSKVLNNTPSATQLGPEKDGQICVRCGKIFGLCPGHCGVANDVEMYVVPEYEHIT